LSCGYTDDFDVFLELRTEVKKNCNLPFSLLFFFVGRTEREKRKVRSFARKEEGRRRRKKEEEEEEEEGRRRRRDKSHPLSSLSRLIG